jgi:hypothetical protein
MFGRFYPKNRDAQSAIDCGRAVRHRDKMTRSFDFMLTVPHLAHKPISVMSMPHETNQGDWSEKADRIDTRNERLDGLTALVIHYRGGRVIHSTSLDLATDLHRQPNTE